MFSPAMQTFAFHFHRTSIAFIAHNNEKIEVYFGIAYIGTDNCCCHRHHRLQSKSHIQTLAVSGNH